MLPAYGNTIAQTPHIDQLATQSAVFDAAYCNFPLCAPSRFSMMSGRLASRISAYDNGAEFASSIPTFAHYLRASQYQTALIGKMHFVGADQLHGFEERLTTDIYPADFGWTGDWTEVAMPHGNNPITFTDAGVCLRNVQMDYDEEVVHRSERKLYDLARSDDQRPFFLTVSLTHPHDPYQCTQEYWDLYRHDDIDPPKVSRIDGDAADPYSQRLLMQYGLDAFIPSEEQIATARHAYYGSLSYLDHQIGRLFKVLQDTGYVDNTVIVLTSDHGDMLGERGLWYKKTFFEDSVRVPLMISAPGYGASRVKQNVSLVDLVPTFVDLAQNPSLPESITPLDGNSLRPLLDGDTKDWDDTVYAENLAEGAMTPILMVRKGRYKYIVSGIDPAQLFDLVDDPLEVRNIYGDPAYQAIAKELDDLASQTWNREELTNNVADSQRQRLFLGKVLQSGKTANWDYQPTDQASNQCLRPDQSYNQWAYNNVLRNKTDIVNPV